LRAALPHVVREGTPARRAAQRLAGTDSLLVCPLTTTFRDAPAFRLLVEATTENRLRERSYLMVDKVQAVRIARCRPTSDHIGPDTMAELGASLAFALGLADA
jgi:mRNA interferase MazF